jgi:hypothetical protein
MVAAALPHELRLFVVAFATAVAAYVLLSSYAFAPPPPPKTPVLRPPHTTRVIHIRTPIAPVVRGGAQR